MADGSIVIDTSIDNSGAESGLSKLGSIASKGFKAISASVAVATTAVGVLTKSCIDQFATYEQLKGGVETLFKDSSNKVMEYANNAFANAGLSANEYMDTVTSFSASLLQGLGGDTEKAAEIGNMAVEDMSDNANKMGTSMEMIQNAYQGFAKQNYTMLDNLKLGYGGTKEEMERLLADAEKISGVHYDISNFSDIIEAIHVIQDEIGITGTTADEAKTTIEGSLNMTKAAWTNLMTGIASGSDNFDMLIDNLITSITYLEGNLEGRLITTVDNIGKMIDSLVPIVIEKIPPLIESVFPRLIECGIKLVTSLINGIEQMLPTLMPLVVQIITTLVTAIMQMLPQLLEMGIQIIVSLTNGIAQQLPTLIPAAIKCIMQLINTLIENLPLILDAGMQLLDGLIEGIVNAIPDLIAMLPIIIETIVNFIVSSLPEILQKGCEILLSLINGLVEAIPDLIAMLPTIIDTIINFITNNLPQILQMGIQVLISLINGVVNAIPQLVAMLPQIINTIINTLTAHLPEIIMAGIQILVALAKGLIQAIPQLVGQIPTITKAIFKAFNDVNWLDIGINIIKGIGKGIGQMASWLWEKAKEVVGNVKDKVCDFLGIHSPSRLFRDVVGINIVKGIGVGFDKESPELNKLAVGNMEDLYDSLRGTVDVETAKTTAAITSSNYSYNNNKTTNNDNRVTQNVTIVNPERTPSENARALKKAGRDLAFG